MVNVYVHLRVRDLAEDVIFDDDFVEGIWRELPDAGVGGGHDGISITLSQYAVSADAAARRQANRARRALSSAGWSDAIVELDDIVREGLRDDIRCVIDAVRWRLRR